MPRVVSMACLRPTARPSALIPLPGGVFVWRKDGGGTTDRALTCAFLGTMDHVDNVDNGGQPVDNEEDVNVSGTFAALSSERGRASEQAVLGALRQLGPLSSADLARVTAMASRSVRRVCDRLGGLVIQDRSGRWALTVSGTVVRISMLVRTRSSATRPGNMRASEPVARSTFFALRRLVLPSFATSTVSNPFCAGPVSFP